MPRITKFLGEMFPVNRLSGVFKSPSAKRRDETHSLPQAQPPPKRRKTDDDDDDDDGQPLGSSPTRPQSYQNRQGHQGRRRSDAGSDVLIQPSPDRSLRQHSVSAFSSSQGGGGGRNHAQAMNQPELRQAERNSITPNSRRRRRRSMKNRALGDGGSLDRPMSLRSPSPSGTSGGRGLHYVVDDDQRPFEEVAPPLFSKEKQVPSRVNTNMTILLSDGRPNTKARFRSRMNDGQQRLQDSPSNLSSEAPQSMGPPERQNGATKRPIYGTKHFNGSVDELSEDFFPGRPAKKQQTRGSVVEIELYAASRAAEKKKQPLPKPTPASTTSNGARSALLPMAVENIIAAPLRVKAAFRQPDNCFVSDVAADVPLFTLTIDAPSPDVLMSADLARARREKLHWLRADLLKTREITYGIDTPVVFFMFPQGDGLGALLGLQFYAVEDARRLVTWAAESPLLKGFKLDEATTVAQERKFNKCLADVQERLKGRMEATAELRTAHDATDDNDGKLATYIASSEPPSLIKAVDTQNPPWSPDPSAAVRLSPAMRGAFTDIRRTRSSRGLNDVAETVDLEGATKKTGLPRDDSSTGLMDTRLGRLRNRSARLSATRHLPDIEIERWTITHPDWANDWRVPLTYSRTTVDKDDVARLDEGEFLNDNIINFYMQYLQDTLKKSAPSIAKRIYFHNTFFYEKLRPNRGRDISFGGVKRWTAKVDLFSYDYIVVPVNEHAHWWVAIICNVPKILAAALPQSEKSEPKEPELDEPQTNEPQPGEPEKSEKSKKPMEVDDAEEPEAKAMDLDEPKETKSVSVDDDDEGDNDVKLLSVSENPTPKLSASPLRLNGQEKGTPINVDDADANAKLDRKESGSIVLDSVEIDDVEANDIVADIAKTTGVADSADTAQAQPKPTPSPIRVRDDDATDKNNSRQIDKIVDDDDDDEVTEIKSDLVPLATPPAVSAKKPFRGGGARNSKKVFIPGGKKQDPKDPRIFTLDSLGSVHTASVDHLKQWLVAEIAERRDVKPADPGRLGTTAKAIPQQENFCDCGVYLLLYIQEFIKDPDSFIEDIVLRQERKWDTSAPDMRTQLRDLILYMQKEYQTTEEANRKPKKKIPPPKRAGPDATAVASAASASTSASTSALAPPANGETADAQGSPSLVQLSSPCTPAGRPSSPAKAADADADADVPIPSSGMMDQREDQAEASGSSVGPAEPGYSSPFREGSPNVFRQQP